MESLQIAFIALALMFGIIAHIVKKVIEVRESDRTFSMKRYLTENPYKTFMVFFYAIGGAFALHMDGTLSVYTAIVTGFAANSLSGKGKA